MIIFANGNFEDAALYQAGPVPMAIEPGTQYEVQREGVPQGLFTAQQAGQQKDAWYATGRWTTQAQIAAAEAAKAAQAKAAEARKPRPLILEKDDRPVLRRAPAPTSEPASPPASTPPAATSTTASAPNNTPSTSGSAGEQQPADNSQAVEARAPGRPVLRRRESKGEQVTATEKASRTRASKLPPSAASEKSLANPAIWGTAEAPQELVAVSDAAPSDQHPYTFSWTPDEQTMITKKMGDLAQRELQKYLSQRGLVAADAKNWRSLEVRAFDLYFDNDAELVLTGVRAVRKMPANARRATTRPAQADPDALNAYATVIAYMDPSNELHVSKFEASDDGQLDVTGRLRLIDAVDATGDTRGELLFQRLGRGSSSYELYRVYPDSVYQLFDSAHPVR